MRSITSYMCINQLIKILLLGIYLVSFIAIWCANLHKLPPLVYTIYIKHKLYGVSYDFIMCRIRDFALFLVKICRIIQKYPPLWRKDFFIENFSVFCIQYTEIFIVGFFPSHPLLYSPTKNYYLYYHKFVHIKFYTRDKILIVGLKESHLYIKAFILQK